MFTRVTTTTRLAGGTIGANSYISVDINPTAPSGYNLLTFSVRQIDGVNSWCYASVYNDITDNRYKILIKNINTSLSSTVYYAVDFIFVKSNI